MPPLCSNLSGLVWGREEEQLGLINHNGNLHVIMKRSEKSIIWAVQRGGLTLELRSLSADQMKLGRDSAEAQRENKCFKEFQMHAWYSSNDMHTAGPPAFIQVDFCGCMLTIGVFFKSLVKEQQLLLCLPHSLLCLSLWSSSAEVVAVI